MNVVVKYGSSAIDSTENILKLADQIAASGKADYGLAIVVSALGRSRDKLMTLAEKMGEEIPEEEQIKLLASGEETLASLLAIALRNKGVHAVSMAGYHGAGISDEESPFSDKRFMELNIQRVKSIIREGGVPVVAGFQNMDHGSNISAVGIAGALEWDCEILTDNAALTTADPAIYPQAKHINHITYDEMMEMSHLGNWSLESGAIELAKKFNVRLFLGNPFETDKSKGTYVMNNTNLFVEDTPVTSINLQENISIFTFKDIPNDGKAVAECFRLLESLRINIDMISQQVTGEGKCSVSFSCSKEQGEKLLNSIPSQEMLRNLDIESQTDLAMVSMVGVGMATHSGVASKFFGTLATEDIPYYHISTSEISLSATVDMSNKGKAVIALCEAFDL